MRWEKRTKWVRYSLLKEGLVKDTPRGIWEISEKGRLYMEKHKLL
jgi:restriction endonuclease Mrr